MEKSLAGKTCSKLLKLQSHRDKIKESVEIQFTDDSNFSFKGSYYSIYETDGDCGDDIIFKDFNGQGIYEVIGDNPDRKETIIKLVFSKLSKKETENMRFQPKIEREYEVTDLTTIFHFLDVYGTDMFFEDTQIYEKLQEENLFVNLWNKEIKILVESGVPQDQAYKSIYDYIHTERELYPSHFNYDQYVVEIFRECIPEFNYQDFSELQNILLYTVYSEKVSTVHQQLLEWKKAGYRLDNFVKNNNLEEYIEKLKTKVLERNGNNVPENMQL